MKKILLVSVAAALVVGAIAFYLLFGDFNNKNQEFAIEDNSQSIEKSEDSQTKAISGTDTMAALMAKGENLECVVNYDSVVGTATTTSGTYFTSRGRMRGDFLQPEMGKDSISSMILTNDTLYTWTVVEGEKYGMKISLTDLETSKNTDKAPEAREVVPLDAKVDYECKVWNVVDGSIFEPPTDIIFKDYKDLMNTGMEFGNIYAEEGNEGSSNEVQCSLCNEISGEGKKECLVAFSCE